MHSLSCMTVAHLISPPFRCPEFDAVVEAASEAVEAAVDAADVTEPALRSIGQC